MISTKEELKLYLKQDKQALAISRKFPIPFADEIWRFVIYLRKHEYYYNTNSNKLMLFYYACRHHYLGVKLGFSIPINVFGAGLRIHHWGYITVNEKAKVGPNCQIFQGVNIGENFGGGLRV